MRPTTNTTVDVLVVGAGPAGLATATFAARRGLSVAVIDRRRLPLDKACGEGVMPAGVELLEELGVRVAAKWARPFEGIRFLEGDLAAEGRFSGRPGLGIRRSALSVALVERADQAGVQLRHGEELRGWRQRSADELEVETSHGGIRASWLVGADGLHSRVRRLAGLERASGRAPRYGVRRHFRVEPWTNMVEVHWADGAEAYVTPVGPHEVGVAVLWSGDGRNFGALLRDFPALRERLAGVEAAGTTLGAGPFHQRVRRRFEGRVVLVGDAAGYLDPITGEGITLGLRAAKCLAETLAGSRSLRDYERAYRRLYVDYALLTEGMLLAARWTGLRSRLISSLARRPWLFDRLVDINSGERPIYSVGVSGALQLAATLLPIAA